MGYADDIQKTNEKPKITVTVPDGNAPLYMQYPGQYQPQDAFLEFDTETGELTADYNPEIGNAVRMSVYHGIDRRYSIDRNICGESLKRIMNDPEVISLLERIYDGSETVWNGSNHVCRLTKDAEKAEENLQNLIDSSIDPETDLSVIITDDYFIDEVRNNILPGTTDEQIKEIVVKWEGEVESQFPGRFYLDCDLKDLCLTVRTEKREEEKLSAEDEEEGDEEKDQPSLTKLKTKGKNNGPLI